MPADDADLSEPVPSPEGRFAPFACPGFTSYWLTLFLAGLSVQVVTVSVGWQVYALTSDPFMLGLVGLSQFAPGLLLVFVTGAVVDGRSRRAVLMLSFLAEAVAALALFAFTLWGGTHVIAIFAAMVLLGTARAFYNPARQSLVPNLVPPKLLGNAISITTTTIQATMIGGPMIGGLLFGLSAPLAYGVAGAMLLAAFIAAATITEPQRVRGAEPPGWAALSAGFRYIWTEKVIRGAVSLDLFVVLFGGVVALLPIYASDILDAGPAGLGLLRAGPGVGAVAVGIWIIANPVRDHAGLRMFAAVGVFGLAITIFAVSEMLWLSVMMLMIMGACDMISVNVRHTLVQLWTPDALRGRVAAVNSVVLGASNELGAFRAGSMAALFGPVPAVFLGGVGAMAVTGLWARWFPELRNIRRLDTAHR